MMTDISGGRVLAGEDSEEDDDNEEEMSFQMNSIGSLSTPVAPRFATSIVVTSSAKVEGEEKESSDEDNEEYSLKAAVELVKEKNVDEEEQKAREYDKDERLKSLGSKPSQVAEVVEEGHPSWRMDEALDGIQVMSDAFVDTVRPSLDATIHRIAELKESQQRLLTFLREQNAEINSIKQLKDAAVVLDKLPYYAKKLEGIKLAMHEISARSEKMKRRAENLRIDAQSYAIKKENKRDNEMQWNKLYAAKSSKALD